MKKKRKPIYGYTYDGIFSHIEMWTENDEGYDRVYEKLTFEDYTPDDLSFNRAKMVKALKKELKQRINDLQYCLKHIK